MNSSDEPEKLSESNFTRHAHTVGISTTVFDSGVFRSFQEEFIFKKKLLKVSSIRNTENRNDDSHFLDYVKKTEMNQWCCQPRNRVI